MSTPSKRRRLGREAFENDPHGVPEDWIPWQPGSWNYRFHLDDFMDGWEEGKVAHETKKTVKCKIEYAHEFMTFNYCPHCGEEL